MIPGLILVAGLATAALWIAGVPWVKENVHISALLLVILLGMGWKSLLPVPEHALPGIRMAQRPILRWAVAGLGFRLSVHELWSLGGPALVVVTISTFPALVFGWWIAERLKLSHKLSLLLGVGGAICGASAIAAADSVVQSDKEESAVALGTITLLGRGSVCINTGGEKVYPEEVEEALKLHPGVHDANVVGLPDDRWGQRIAAVVSCEPDTVVTEDELKTHCKNELAGYKCPKEIVVVDRVERGPNGKPDYRWATAVLER